MASKKPVDKLADNLKGLVIGASGAIPGYQHGEIKWMVEQCGAKFASMNIREFNRAREVEGCEIVDIDWLIKKIKKHIPESVQQKILKREKNKEIKLKGEKRQRDVSLGDDERNPPKKTKDEEQVNLKKLIGLVDEKYPTPSSTLSVYQDDAGLIWDATLVRQDVKNQVEVLRIQLLVDDESRMFHTWDLKYQFGSSQESTSMGDVGSLDSAKRTFETKFKSFSHLAWEDRHAASDSKGSIFLETHHREAPILNSETSPLPASVEKVLKIIFTSGSLNNYVTCLYNHGRRILLEAKVDKKKLLVGIAVLGKLMKLTNPQLATGDNSNTKKRLCKIYESLILKNVTLATAHDTVRQELESLDLLLKLRDASEILEKKSQSFSLAMSQITEVLGLATMTPGISPLEIIGVFRLERPGEAERFAQWEKANHAHVGDRRLLWHGSRASNFAGILSQGLRGDGIVSTDGKHFVPGVFFADISTKSAGYCRQQGEALILLCEVELGTSSAIATHCVGSTVHKKWRDAGYIHPDFKGSQVPDVRAGTMTASGTPSYYHSEYVAKSPAQVRQRYLFHVKLA
ncbi:hypothetical protein PITC_076860 [Penicillium italicum]|uniref:Poly [ADP-ribose] polymerase n=1 Tax=Penicillium italicum TaxID=40296 RepID=A0A0A2KM05_PENIT|nr:hypothetical protein PITC_076860 [Penicillium italicum]